METNQIKAVLLSLFHRCKLNVSVFVLAADEVINRDNLVYPVAVVQNNQGIGRPGLHWVAWFIAKDDDKGEMFDSYGLPLWKYPEIKKPVHTIVKENCYVLQSLLSSVCGQFCIYYLFNRASGVSYENILGKFKSKKYNDNLVKNFVRDIPIRSHCTSSGGQCCVSRIKCLKCLTPGKKMY